MISTDTTVRQACRQGRQLGGADAQALEGALCQMERFHQRLRAAARAVDVVYHHSAHGPSSQLMQKRMRKLAEVLHYAP